MKNLERESEERKKGTTKAFSGYFFVEIGLRAPRSPISSASSSDYKRLKA